MVWGTRARRGLVALATLLSSVLIAAPVGAAPQDQDVTVLTADDFRFGTYVIDQPGTYRLGEDIVFNPNSPATLTAAIADGTIPGWMPAAFGWSIPVTAYHSSMPLVTQFASEPPPFTPGGPLDARYDPAAYGVGFFAAIAISADDVVLDLAGHRIEQSEEHALLQRFFAVIELADQPFKPSQGPAGFGDELDPAENVVIQNGVIGLSSHHGIHGNDNRDVTIRNVRFDGYEVGAVALNGVDGLKVENVTATNRKDVPVLGTYSSAQFIKAYVDHLVASGSSTTLTVDGVTLSAADIQAALRQAIEAVHEDVIVDRHQVDGRAGIDAAQHPVEYGLFHNPHGLIDGNSYSFLVNVPGVAVNGFPWRPDGVTSMPSRDIMFRNVRVIDQESFINEVPALDVGGGAAAIDPVGAVFQVANEHPDTGVPVTVSVENDLNARYTGNPVANAQALVAKAKLAGEFDGTHLDVTRANLTQGILDWVEGVPGSETLGDIGASYLCNGDSMFHVNKGTIAYKMDGAENVTMVRTSVDGLTNLGVAGSDRCGDYLESKSHPLATLYGYGGNAVRAYTFSGSTNVRVLGSSVRNLSALSGPAAGFAVLTDSTNVLINRATVRGVDAGWGGPVVAPSHDPYAMGFYVGPDAGRVRIVQGCTADLVGSVGFYVLHDLSGNASYTNGCR